MTPYQQWSLANGGKQTDKEIKFDTQAEYEAWLAQKS